MTATFVSATYERIGLGIVFRTYIHGKCWWSLSGASPFGMHTGDILGLDELFDQTRFESLAAKHGGRADLTAVPHSVFFLKRLACEPGVNPIDCPETAESRQP